MVNLSYLVDVKIVPKLFERTKNNRSRDDDGPFLKDSYENVSCIWPADRYT